MRGRLSGGRGMPLVEALRSALQPLGGEPCVLLAPGNAWGQGLVKALVRRHKAPAPGVSVMTPLALAQRLAEPGLLDKRLLDEASGAWVLDRILCQEPGRWPSLLRFGAQGPQRFLSVNGRLFQLLLSLRHQPACRQKLALLAQQPGESGLRFKNLASLLAAYESSLAQPPEGGVACLLDEAGLFALALESAGQARALLPSVRLLAAGQQLWPAEQLRFLQALDGALKQAFGAQAGLALLQGPRAELPSKAQLPHLGRLAESGPAPDAESAPLAQALAVGGARPSPALTQGWRFFCAASPSAELREGLRLALDQGAALDEIEALTLSPAETGLAAEMLALAGGPAFTPGYGLPLAQMPAAEGFLCLLGWASAGQSAGLLAAGLRQGWLRLPPGSAEGLKPRDLARALEELSIGFGASRYEPAMLQALAQRNQQASQKPVPPEAFKALQLLAAELLMGLPQGRSLSLAGLASWLRARALKLVALPLDEAGQGHFRGLLHALGELALAAAKAQALPAEEAVELLQKELALRLKPAQAPKPGAIHISQLESGAVAFRPHILLLGLDESRFPGSPSPDPFLAAEELKALGLATPEDRVQARLLCVLQALADLGRPQSLSAGFCSHDAAANREKAASGLGLQIFRLRQPKAGYREYLAACGEPAGLAPRRAEDSLGLMELGLCLGLRGQGDAAGLLEPRSRRGLRAMAARREPGLGSYDSLLAPASIRLEDQRWSATQLDDFLDCPRRWLYAKVLKLRPVEDEPAASDAWLDPAAEGTLMHAFLQWHQSRAMESGQRPSAQECAAAMEALIAEAKLDHAQPGAGLAKPQEEALRRAAHSYPEYLARALEPGWKPEATELELAAAQGGPLQLRLPGGLRIAVGGYIDYAESKDGRWRVWDYKTGKSADFKPGSLEANGAQLLVYLAGLKAWLKERQKSGQAAGAGYLFPSQRGGFARMAFDATAEEAEEKLAGLLAGPFQQAFAAGCFAPTENAGCGYCDFKAACDLNAIKARVSAQKGGG